MSYIGHPIVGDLVYGLSNNQIWQAENPDYKQPRQLLHASTLVFNHPISQQSITLSAPIPKDMQEFLRFIQK
jgi:23S rRNA pseudouridine1911/1915/1917 synthase